MDDRQDGLVAIAAVALGLNVFLLSVDVYGAATDINAKGHDLVGLAHSLSATAAIRMAGAVQLQAPRNPAVIAESGARPAP